MYLKWTEIAMLKVTDSFIREEDGKDIGTNVHYMQF